MLGTRSVSAGANLEVVVQLQQPPPWHTGDLQKDDYLAHLTGATLEVDHGVASFSTIDEEVADGTFGHRFTIGDIRLISRASARAALARYEGTWWGGVWQEFDDDIAPELRGGRVTITTNLLG